MRALVGVIAATAMAWNTGAAPLQAPGSFAGWAAVVVSGDDHAAHVDLPTAAFDNARRDVAAAFEQRGVSAANLAQVSVADHDAAGEVGVMRERLEGVARRARAGCIVYVTSHGSPDGVLIGDRLDPPRTFATMVEAACPKRPAAVILSACYSGVFVPALEAALGSRAFILTAARKDRSSFGCGEDDRYPFFDGCVIQTLPVATDFGDLADRVRSCVVRREDQEGMRPRSEPQLFMGRAFRTKAPAFAEAHSQP